MLNAPARGLQRNSRLSTGGIWVKYNRSSGEEKGIPSTNKIVHNSGWKGTCSSQNMAEKCNSLGQ